MTCVSVPLFWLWMIGTKMLCVGMKLLSRLLHRDMRFGAQQTPKFLACSDRCTLIIQLQQYFWLEPKALHFILRSFLLANYCTSTHATQSKKMSHAFSNHQKSKRRIPNRGIEPRPCRN